MGKDNDSSSGSIESDLVDSRVILAEENLSKIVNNISIHLKEMAVIIDEVTNQGKLDQSYMVQL